MARDDEFWQLREDWSRRKHLVLNYYLEPATAKLGFASRDRRVVILDGFAGRGKYGNDEPGSPILMGQLADKCRTWQKPVDLKTYNIEPDRESFQELEACTTKWVQEGSTTNLNGTFQKYLPTVLKAADNNPLFAFLDPFRPKHLAFADFAPLLARTAITEVCIVFHTPAIIRMIESVRPDAQTPDDTKAATSATLDAVFGGNRWRNLWHAAQFGPEDVVNCFAEELAERSPINAFIRWHAISARYQAGLKYHIVFFTRHPEGVKVMNDAFWKEAQDVYAATPAAQSGQVSLFVEGLSHAVEMDKGQRLSFLRDTLITIGKRDPNRVWQRPSLIFESMLARFAEFSETEHRQAIQQLLDTPIKPKIRALDRQPSRSGRYRINDTDRLQFEF